MESYRICIFLTLISLSIMSSRFIHAVACDRLPFFKLKNVLWYVHTTFCLPIHLPMDIFCFCYFDQKACLFKKSITFTVYLLSYFINSFFIVYSITVVPIFSLLPTPLTQSQLSVVHVCASFTYVLHVL